MGLRMDQLHAPTVSSGPSSQPLTNSNEKEVPLQELIAQKENVEAELSALGSVLDSHGVNMSTSLTTFDGYPRADIDVAQIRTTRARIIRLKTDHKEIMQKLDSAVSDHFAKAAQNRVQYNVETTVPSTVDSNPSSVAALEPPFARVNTVVPSSPADQAGLRVGDKVTKFGSVNFTNHERLSRVAQVVQQNENRVVLVKILRETYANAPSQSHELRLTPKRDWGGRGLLGCHLLPI